MKNGKFCTSPFNLPPHPPTHPSVCQPTPYNFNSMQHSDQQFAPSLQWNRNTFPQHTNDFYHYWKLCHRNMSCIGWFNWSHIRSCVASIMQRQPEGTRTFELFTSVVTHTHTHTDRCDFKECSQRPIILPLFAVGGGGADETFSHW